MGRGILVRGLIAGGLWWWTGGLFRLSLMQALLGGCQLLWSLTSFPELLELAKRPQGDTACEGILGQRRWRRTWTRRTGGPGSRRTRPIGPAGTWARSAAARAREGAAARAAWTGPGALTGSWSWPAAARRTGVTALSGTRVRTRWMGAAPIAIRSPWRLWQSTDRCRPDWGRRQCRAAGTRRPRSISAAPALTLLTAGLATALAAPRATLAASRTLGPRLHHRQRHPLAFLVDAHHPGRDHVTHAHHIVRALDVTIGKLTDVHQSRVFQTNIHERPEVHDVQDRALQLHPRRQILELEDALLEDRLGQIFTRVALGPAQGLDDVTQGELTDAQLLGKRGDVGLGQLRPQSW